MWQWILIGAGAYVVLLIMVLAVAASARAADRRERAMFASWLAEKRRRIVPVPALRPDHRRAA
jgi:hypothetical protein